MNLTAPVFAFAASVPLSACNEDPPLAVAHVDLAQFQGKWYEIAKLPRATETDCEDTTATYRLLAENKLAVQNECHANGATRRMIAEAVATDPATPAKLSLDVGGFFGDYWILEVGKSYDYAVIGHPTRRYFWILGRTPSLEKGVLDGIVERAGANQFDLSRLEYTVQSDAEPAPAAATAPKTADPPEYGCGIVRRRHSRATSFGLVGVILALVLRRRADSRSL